MNAIEAHLITLAEHFAEQLVMHLITQIELKLGLIPAEEDAESDEPIEAGGSE